MVFFIVESSHLFRAGDKFQTQFFVMDVVNFIRRTFFEDEPDVKVYALHGSVKDEQADRYTAALERHNVKVIRMKPIDSMIGGKWYFKPTWYMHRMMGTDIPQGSSVVLVGFHNIRYFSFLKKYSEDFKLSLAAFTTPSKKQGMMSIPENFAPFLTHVIDLDKFVTQIKAEFKRKLSSKP